MRRKIAAFALAMIMAVVPVSSVAASEVLLDESSYEEIQTELTTSVESEEEVPEIQTEEMTEPSEENKEEIREGEEIQPEELIDDFLVRVEEVNPAEDGLVTESDDLALLDTVVVQLDASGYASDARPSNTRIFYAGRYIDSYGGQLSEEAKNVYNTMKAAYVDSREPVQNNENLEITFATPFPIVNSKESKAAQTSIKKIMQSAFDAFIYDYPEVFWMDAPGYSYMLTSLRYPSVITGVTLMPQMIYEGAGTQVPAFDQAVISMYNAAMQGADTFTVKGKVKAIHDYLCNLLTYDEGTTDLAQAYAHSAAGVFLSATKHVVCEGYAKAFKILCREAGIESVLMVGYAGGAHMWNYIKMDDGNWYLVDVTWDDGPSGIPSETYFLAGSSTRGSSGSTIGTERAIYTNFSSSSYSQNFAVPIQSYEGYTEVTESSHSHVWETEEKAATCMEAGYLRSECTICHVKTSHILRAEHSFAQGVYVYNGDATCVDGTSSLYCDYGCGTKASDIKAKTRLPYTIQATGTATGHSFLKGIYVYNHDATCTVDGTSSLCCDYGCGTKAIDVGVSTEFPYTVQEHGTATGHSFVKGNYVYNQDATCTSNGTGTLYCDHGCGTKASDLNAKTSFPYVKDMLGTATGHRFENYVADTAAGWYRDSTRTAVCENGCGTKHTVSDPGTALIPTIKVNVSSITLKKGQSTTAVKVSGLAKGDKIKSWKSDNTGIVKVNKSGKITAQKKAGKATVTVTLDSGLKKSISVKVQSGTVKTTKISGVPKTLKLSVGKKSTLSATVSPVTSQEKVTYTSSNKKVATVSSKGVITAKSAGKVKITVKSGNKKATVTVTVSKVAPKKITNVPTTLTLKKGKTRTLKPKLSPTGSEAKITYRSSNKSIATVSAGGRITAKKKGTAVITVKAGSIVVKCKLTVK